MTGVHPPPVCRVVAILAVLCLLAACGTRRTHEELLLAQTGPTTDIAPSGDSVGPSEVTAPSGVPQGEATATTVPGGGPASPVPTEQSGGSVDSGTDPAAAPARADGTLLRIGSVGTISGAAGEAFAPMVEGLRAWSRWVNDHGGLNGHPVEILVADDGGDPARHLALVREFVERQGVIAFASNAEALTGQSSVDYLTGAGVPVIGSEGAGDWFYSSPVYFPQGSHGLALIQAGVATAAYDMEQRGMTKMGIVACSEAQACRDAYEKTPRIYAKYGIEVVYRAQVSLAQPDFTAECLNAKQAGAQAISVALPANNIRSFARSCARQDYFPLIGIAAGAAVDDLRNDPNLEHLSVYGQQAPWTTASSPRRTEFRDAMATYLPTTTPTAGHMIGWVSGKVVELGSVALPAEATSADLVAGLQSIHGDALPDLTAPLLFNRGAPASRSVCGYVTIVEDGEYVAAYGGERQCVDYDPNV